jgi:hypothetical protein
VAVWLHVQNGISWPRKNSPASKQGTNLHQPLLDQCNLVDRVFESELSILRIGDIWIQTNPLEFTSHASFFILGVKGLFGEGNHIFCVEMEGLEFKFMC